MPQKILKFTGINRKVNEFQASGACEEMINLRADAFGGLRVVKPKHELETRTNYFKIYEHSFGGSSNLIAVNTVGEIVYVNADGGPVTIQDKTHSYDKDDIEVSFAGNVLLVNYLEKQMRYVYKFVDGKYEEYIEDVKPLVDVDIDLVTNLKVYAKTNAEDDSVAAYTHALNAAASKFTSDYPNGLCGAAVVGLTYEYSDGSEDWSTGFIVANATRYYKVSEPTIETADNSSRVVTVYGVPKARLQYNFNSKSFSGVKRVNVYASKQVLPYKIEQDEFGKAKVVTASLDELNLDGELMYYQGSIDISEYGVVTGTMPLKFNAEQLGESVMEVTSGCVERTGKTFSFNNRFFYYDSIVNHVMQVPTVQQLPSIYDPSIITASDWIAYVKINKKWIMVDRVYSLVDNSKHDFIYPMADIEELAFVKVEYNADGEMTVPYEKVFYVKLKDSSAYNYSYAFDVTPEIVDLSVNDDFYLDVMYNGQKWGDEFTKKVFLKKEDNAINASAQFNPFVFPVKYSYSVGGKILDIATAYMPISATQISQYPITVFTSNGIYSMEQGDGSVLFQNTVPIQPLAITGKAVSTPYGTFFVSSKNIYRLIGREVECVSDALYGELESRLKENDSYKALCFKYGTDEDFSYHISRHSFDEDIDGVTMSYDPLQNELYINCYGTSNKYAYVLNLGTKSFHKVTRRHYVFQNGCRYALADGEYALSIVDLHSEDKATRPVLLQSRPFSLEAFFTHIQRLILFADAKLEGSHNLNLSVFASDNLYDWKCIISAQKADAVIRHIRTNKAAKSYREYVVLINGMVSTDTDISEIIADYTLVNRRLG